jgi:hypothetical protein
MMSFSNLPMSIKFLAIQFSRLDLSGILCRMNIVVYSCGWTKQTLFIFVLFAIHFAIYSRRTSHERSRFHRPDLL